MTRSKHSSRRDDDDDWKRSRSRSPYRRRRDNNSSRYRSPDSPRFHEPSPRREERRERYGNIKEKYDASSRNDKPYHRSHSDRPYAKHETITPPDSQKSKMSDVESERAAKLAAMQFSAAELEESRNKRLAEMEVRDALDKEAEDRKRMSKGDKFVGGLRKQAADVGLEGRLGNQKGGLERLDRGF